MGSLEMVIALLTGAVLLGDSLGQLEITAMALMILALMITPMKNSLEKQHLKNTETG